MADDSSVRSEWDDVSSTDHSVHEHREAFMLTTSDNPFNPFTQWDEWYSYDEKLGYHTCALLARITVTSDELSDTDQDQTVQHAIDEIVLYNVSGMHRKVSIQDYETE